MKRRNIHIKKIRFFLILLILFLFILQSQCFLENNIATVTNFSINNEGLCELKLNATNDSYIYQKNPSVNYGSESYLEVSNNYGNNSSDWKQNILIKFNLSTIPSNTTISSANLYLYYYHYGKNDTVGRNLSIRKIISNWNEANVTWNNKPLNSSINASYSAVPSSFGWISWNILSDVRDFVNGTRTNYGWQIHDLKQWGTYDIPISRFKSRETQTNYTPYLKIIYDTPLVTQTNGPYYGNISEKIQFNGSYLGNNILPVSWLWDFGDGVTSDKRNTTHIYEKAGSYKINLITKGVNGKEGNASTVAVIKDNKCSNQILEIASPKKGLYINNNKILSFFNTIIIGDVDIEINISDEDYIFEKIEFYLNEKLEFTDTTRPYSWTWDNKTLFKFRHIIKVIAYDHLGNSFSDEIFVWRLF